MSPGVRLLLLAAMSTSRAEPAAVKANTESAWLCSTVPARRLSAQLPSLRALSHGRLEGVGANQAGQDELVAGGFTRHAHNPAALASITEESENGR